jgi:hypothetical protein
MKPVYLDKQSFGPRAGLCQRALAPYLSAHTASWTAMRVLDDRAHELRQEIVQDPLPVHSVAQVTLCSSTCRAVWSVS